jgi:hypothetical protein
MTRRERLMKTLKGEPVDRPAVCFYELNGLDEDPDDPDPFNIYSHPSWKPLIDLTRRKTDRIVMRGVPFVDALPNPAAELTSRQQWIDSNGSRMCRTTVRAGGRTLTRLDRTDPDVRTTWTVEHLLKDEDDLEAWLALPRAPLSGRPDVRGVLEAERIIGDTGIVMIDVSDPLCELAEKLEMGQYTVLGLTRPDLMHRALEKIAAVQMPRVEAISEALPGRLWRIYGPEYASPPYLPPRLFAEYVTRYVTPMVRAIHKHGGFARVHSHGRLRDLNWGASYLVHDFYQRFIKPNASEKHYVLVSRLVTTGLMVLTALTVPLLTSAKDSFDLMLSIGAGTGLIYLLRWFWWRINAWSEVAAMISSFTISLVLFFGKKYELAGMEKLSTHLTLAASVGFTSLVWIVVTLLTRPTDHGVLVRFYRLTRPFGPGWRSIQQETGLAASPDSVPQALLGWVLSVMMVYAAMFGTGNFIYGNMTMGVVFAAIFAVSAVGVGVILGRVFSKPLIEDGQPNGT